MSHLFCFGVGYSAKALIRRLQAKGWQVSGTTRTAEKAEALEAQGIRPVVFSPDHPMEAPDAALRGVTHVLSSVPPDDSGDPVLNAHGADIARLGSGLNWAGYLSTTGVYGDRQGGWVGENDALRPAGTRGQRRVAAETAWLDLGQRHGIPVHVFRLAGIYGPGRSQLDSVRKGTAKRIDKPGQVFSRIHVEDIAAVLEASMARPNPGAAYNVCDDEPAPPGDVVTYACELLGVEPPPWEPFEEAAKSMSAMGRSFYGESKRCRNDRIKTDLGVTLTYPTYREGLRALLEEGKNS